MPERASANREVGQILQLSWVRARDFRPRAAACYHGSVVRKLESYLAEKARIQLDDSDLTSRSDLRRDRLKTESHYMALAARLCEISEKRLVRLELGEYLLELIDGARRIDSPPARDRALRRIRKELRDLDSLALEAKLDDLDNPGPRKDKAPESVWVERLIASGERELEGFLAMHPDADRGRLRTLLRNAVRAKDSDRPRAVQKLTVALREMLAAGPADPSLAEGELDPDQTGVSGGPAAGQAIDSGAREED